MIIHVKVSPWVKSHPGIKITQDLITWEDIYEIRMHQRPIQWHANTAVVEYLSDYFKTPKRFISIIAGYTSRLKKVEIRDR